MTELPIEILQFFRQQAELYPEDFYLKPLPKKNTITAGPKAAKPEAKEKQKAERFITSGNSQAKILFLCNRPLKDDLISGELISGQAGKLFDKILKAIDLTRKDIYITSLRSVNKAGKFSDNPKIEAINTLIDEMNPAIIVSLGETAGNELLGTSYEMEKCHGKLQNYRGRQFMFTFHPELVRRNNQLKRPVWEDFKRLKEIVKN